MQSRANRKRSAVKSITDRDIIVCLDFMVIYLLAGKVETAAASMTHPARVRMKPELLADGRLDTGPAEDLAFKLRGCHRLGADCFDRQLHSIASAEVFDRAREHPCPQQKALLGLPQAGCVPRELGPVPCRKLHSTAQGHLRSPAGRSLPASAREALLLLFSDS